MPYADLQQQRESQREWFKERYYGDPKFRAKELKRKKRIRKARTATKRIDDREYMREYMRKYRAARKKAKARSAKR